MSFPFDTEEDIVESNGKIPREYGIDFETGMLTGEIVEGKEAVKVWIYLVLKSTRYRYAIYSWDYGNELEDLIGQTYTQEYLNIECKRRLEECLLMNENITDISNVVVTSINDTITINFTANTLYGEVEVNV